MWCYVRAVKAGTMDLLSFVSEAKRIGADGVELLDFFYKDADTERPAVKARLDELGLPCPIFSVANNFAKLEKSDREAQVDRIKFGVDEAVFYGAKVVRVFAGDVAEGLTYDQVRMWIVEGLTDAANYAHDRGVRLALENHGKLAGRGDQVRALIQDVRSNCGHDAMGANPDTGNFVLVDEDSVRAVTEIGDMAYMVHFKDFVPGKGVFSSFSGKTFRGSVIGEGCVDLAGCVKALKACGFDSWLSLEYEGEGDPVSEVERSLVNARNLVSA